jgi:hypothetical protein
LLHPAAPGGTGRRSTRIGHLSAQTLDLET